jgi:hypothetical protein
MSIDETLKEELRIFKNVSAFTENDEAKLRESASVIIPHIAAVTDEFYKQLADEPKTAKYIEGRVDHLKTTHIQWLHALFTGSYDETFIESQLRIGRTHVSAKIPPLFVASSMSYLRSAFPKLINEEIHDDKAAGELAGAVLRILDLCQYLIDHAYEQDRLKRLTEATGLSRPLLENLIALKNKN